MSNRIDATMDRNQRPAAQAHFERSPADAELAQLPVTNDAVLPLGKRPQLLIDRATLALRASGRRSRATFSVYT